MEDGIQSLFEGYMEECLEKHNLFAPSKESEVDCTSTVKIISEYEVGSSKEGSFEEDSFFGKL